MNRRTTDPCHCGGETIYAHGLPMQHTYLDDSAGGVLSCGICDGVVTEELNRQRDADARQGDLFAKGDARRRANP